MCWQSIEITKSGFMFLATRAEKEVSVAINTRPSLLLFRIGIALSKLGPAAVIITSLSAKSGMIAGRAVGAFLIMVLK